MGVTAFESETHGIVNDYHLEGVSPEGEIVLRRLEKDGRITVNEARIRDGVHRKVLEITTETDEEYEINFRHYSVHLGGNTLNAATAMKVTQDALGNNQNGRLGHLFYTHVDNQQIHGNLTKTFSGRGVLKHPAGCESVARKGFYIPKSDKKSDGWYVSQTPEYRYRETAMAGIGTDFFLSTLHPESTLIPRLIDRKKKCERTQITMAPGKQQLQEGIDPDFSEIITLMAMNAKEAMRLLGDEAPKKLEGEALVKEIATRLANRGPENVLITNGGLPVVHYDRIRDAYTIAQPPSIEMIQKIIFDIHGERLPDQDVSRIGCGDTLLGVFMGLEKMRNITRQQALEIAVLISRYHAWDKRPNISEIDPNFLVKLMTHVAPNAYNS